MEEEEIEKPLEGFSAEVSEAVADDNIVEVAVDVYIGDVRFTGKARYNYEDDTIDWKGLFPDCTDDNELFGRLEELGNKNIYYRGTHLGKALHLLSNFIRYKAGDEDIHQCYYSGYYFPECDMKELWDGTMAYEDLAICSDIDDEYYYMDDLHTERVRDGHGSIDELLVPDWWCEEHRYCDHCDCYIRYDEDWSYDYDECIYCAEEEEEDSIIEDYTASHDNEPVFFGDYKDEDSFAGLGFELEVDCDSSQQRHNSEVAEGLCSACGLDSDEMRYAHDGSLNYGFECISQPHTVKDFWDKQDKWRKMLSYLVSNHYKSHDAGTCGLHVHVSRNMFGLDEKEQDKAIAKVYTFFDENWDNLVKVSRRTNFNYCDKNKLAYSDYPEKCNKYNRWKKQTQGKREGGHYVALNNRNSATFEYRLGRGTLNAWSFFSWIDLVLTITKNARRISVNKVVSNDKLSWLGGIKESTAKYIYKRGAFKDEMVALFPNIEWETDLSDNGEN